MLHVRVRKPWAARQLCSGKFELNTTLGYVTTSRKGVRRTSDSMTTMRSASARADRLMGDSLGSPCADKVRRLTRP